MGFFIVMVVGGVVVYNLLKNAKAKQEQWRVAAEHLGLGYNSADFGLTGTISGRKGGHRIVISSFTKSGGNNSKTYTKYHISYHDRIPVDFKITRQTAIHKVGHAFGMQDIETGNPSFDDRALVRGMHPQKVQEFLTPDRQAMITNLLISHTDVSVSNEMIELNKPGKEKDAGIIIRTANSLLSVCNELTDRSRSVAEQVEKVVEIEPIEPPFNPLFTANPIVPEPPMVEINEEPMPAVPIVEPATKSTEPMPTVSEEPPPAIVLYDVQSIAQDLYGGDSSTALKIQPRFEEVYRDQLVTGTGKIQRVSKFSYDPVFKDSKGVKATVEICELSGVYSKIKVRADVVFPSERFGELKNKIDSSISIAGKLIEQNSMLHHLYILGE
ncbi:hypothetical protein P4C99_01400 [Pontiellaceae bacterium B1224]|nr:hypothetical protein [Pontiellaceae bacterium B1224]